MPHSNDLFWARSSCGKVGAIRFIQLADEIEANCSKAIRAAESLEESEPVFSTSALFVRVVNEEHDERRPLIRCCEALEALARKLIREKDLLLDAVEVDVEEDSLEEATTTTAGALVVMVALLEEAFTIDRLGR